MKTDAHAKYLVGIVLVVAVVGVLSLIMGGDSGIDLIGQATSATCTDTDGGFDYLTKGTISGGTWKTTGKTYSDKTDSCNVRGQLQEGFCPSSTQAFYVFKYCNRVLGTGYICYDGACALDSDSDGVPDSLDICSGYDDKVDTDSDETPDGCDTLTDSDGDGVADADDVCEGYDDRIDTDSDGTPDGCDSDDDGDGLTDTEEAAYGTDPTNGDSDNDGLTDYEEITIHFTDPLLDDTDSDGYDDVEETAEGTDPLDASDYPCGGIYDDFSGSSLDTSLWTESMDIGSAVTGYVDEYYLDTTTQDYHTAQLSAAGSDKGVLLQLTRELVEGDVLAYDVIYQSRGGNLISRIYLDGNFVEYMLSDAGGYKTSGNIGYWNGGSEIGDDFGTYHVTVSFGADYAYFEILRPNATTWTETLTGLTAPYTYGVSTRTGHDGYGEFDYDNFEMGC